MIRDNAEREQGMRPAAASAARQSARAWRWRWRLRRALRLHRLGGLRPGPLLGQHPLLSTLRGSVTFDPYEMPRLPRRAQHSRVVGPTGELPAPFTQAQLDSVGARAHQPARRHRPRCWRADERSSTRTAPPATARRRRQRPRGRRRASSLRAGHQRRGHRRRAPTATSTASSPSGRGLMPPYGEKLAAPATAGRWSTTCGSSSAQGGAAGARRAGAAHAAAAAVRPSES